jgi:hypothetical protein
LHRIRAFSAILRIEITDERIVPIVAMEVIIAPFAPEEVIA